MIMNITSAQYIVDLDGTTNISVQATIDGKEMVVPLDPDNRHYAALLVWVAEGNTIEEAD
tara:strand:+ start:1240 stop:1419 length:180 start_codon:yes stop_codon:yes gene_type:complete